jgi:hypothetical protein
MRRKTDVHVEMDDDRWCHAANLVLELEGASSNLITNALFPSNEIIASEKQVSSIDLAWAGAAVSGGTGVASSKEMAEEALGAMKNRQQEAFAVAFAKSALAISSIHAYYGVLTLCIHRF